MPRRALADLVETARGRGSPEAALSALTELRARLDELEARHVRAALDRGMHWAEIAAALGVSKQAAHRKHAWRLKRKPPAARIVVAGRHVLVTEDGRYAVVCARQEARLLGHAAIGTGALLLGLLRNRHAAAARALLSLGIRLKTARQEIAALPAPPPSSAGSPNGLPVSDEARRALEQSLHEALRLRQRHLGDEHILLALLRDDGGAAVQALRALGVAPKEVAEALLAPPRRTGRNVRPGA